MNTGATGALGVLYWAVAGRHVNDAELGLNSTFISIVLALASLSQLNVGVALEYLLPGAAHPGRLVRRAHFGVAGVALVLALSFVVVAPRVAHSLTFLTSPPCAAALVASVVVWSLFSLQDGVLNAMRRSSWVPAGNTAYSIAKLLAVLAAVPVLGTWALAASWVLPAGVAVLVVLLVLWRRPPSVTADRHHPTASVRTYLGWEYVAFVLQQLTGPIVPVVVAATGGVALEGRFFIPWTIVTVLDAAGVSLASALTVQSVRWSDRANLLFAQALKRGLVGAGAAAVALAAFAPQAVVLFGQSSAGESAPVLRLLVLGCVGRMAVALSVGSLRARGESRTIALLVGADSALVLMLGLPALLHGSLITFAASWTVAHALCGAAGLGLARRSAREADR